MSLIEKAKNIIVEKLGEEVIFSEETEQLQPALIIKTPLIREVCLLLRDHPETYFDFLSCVSGVDYGVEKGMLGVVYHLSSIPFQTQLTLKVMIPFDRNSQTVPSVPSVCDIWKTADWHEREAYDMFGIVFSGHPDLRRILCPDDWEGFPLRKDYNPAEYYHGIKIVYDRNNINPSNV